MARPPRCASGTESTPPAESRPWTATPAGLSTTRRRGCSRSTRSAAPASGAGGPAGGSSSMSTFPPGSTGSLARARRPPTRTSLSWKARFTTARPTPSASARARSRRPSAVRGRRTSRFMGHLQLAEEDLGDVIQLRIDEVQLLRRLLERDRDDGVAVERRHHPPARVADEVGREHAVASAEDAIARGGRAAALDVPEHRHAALHLRPRLDLRREERADAAEPHVTELVQVSRYGTVLPALDLRPLRHHDDGGALPARLPGEHILRDLIEIHRALGDEDHVRAAGETAVEGDVAGVTSHHLAHDDAAVRLGGGVEPVDRLGRDRDRRVEAEGVVGAGQIVVDGLRDPDDLHPRLEELLRHPEGVLPPDGDDGLDVVLRNVAEDRLHASLTLERVRPRGAEDGPAEVEDARDRLLVEPEVIAVHEAAPPVPDADELEAVLLAPADHRADDRVQARAVAAAGQDRDLHGSDLPHAPPGDRPRPRSRARKLCGRGMGRGGAGEARRELARRTAGRDREVVVAIKIELPVSTEQIRDLRVGDEVLVSGRLVTARDAAHRALVRGLDERVKAALDGRRSEEHT